MLILSELQLRELNEQFDVRKAIHDEAVTLDFLRGVQFVVDQINFQTNNKEELEEGN